MTFNWRYLLSVVSIAVIFACANESTLLKTSVRSVDADDEVNLDLTNDRSLPTKPFYWYDNLKEFEHPRSDKTSLAVLYNGGLQFKSNEERLRVYLKNAKKIGTKVIVSLVSFTTLLSPQIDPSRPFINTKDAELIAKLENIIKEFDKNESVAGWYIADEPSLDGESRRKKYAADLDEGKVQGWAKSKTMYRLIRQRFASSKKVFSALSLNAEVLEGSLQDSNFFRLRDTFDVLMTQVYPFRQSRFRFPSNMRTLTERLQELEKRATHPNVNKDYMVTVQAFGKRRDDEKKSWRLPDPEEFEFQVYATMMAAKSAKAVGFYARHAAEKAIAVDVTPYPESGAQWLQNVFDPLLREANLFRYALKHPLSEVRSANKAVHGRVYWCPSSGKYKVIIVNNSNSRSESQLTFLEADGRPLIYGSRIAHVINSGAREKGTIKVRIEADSSTTVQLDPWGVLAISFDNKK